MSVTIKKFSTRISFIRHGQVKNPEDLFYGRLPGFKLDKIGLQQAVKVAEEFKNKPLDAVYSSPMLRTRQTASALLQFHPHLKLKTSSFITEVLSAFQGQSTKMLAPYSWDVYTNKDPQYEQPEDVIQRTQKFINRVRKNHYGKEVAAVTHGDVILFLIFKGNKIPVTAENKLRLNVIGILKEYPANGSITTLTFQTDYLEEIPKIYFGDQLLK